MNEELEKAEYELVINSGTTDWYFDEEYHKNKMKKMLANFSDHDLEVLQDQLGRPIHV